MSFRPLKSFFPTADELLQQNWSTLGRVLLTHLKSYEGLNTVYQRAGLNRGYFRAMLENRGIGLGPLPKEPEYGERQPEVTKRMMEAWNWLERQGLLIHNDEQVADWFTISSDGEKFLETEDIAVDGSRREVALAAFGQRARKAFELKVGNLYHRSIQKVHDLKDQYLNEGIASGGKYLRKTADLLVNDFQGIEPVLNETYLQPLSGKPISKADESWLRREIDHVVDFETIRIKNTFDSLASSFVGTTPARSSPYLAQFDELAHVLKRRLNSLLELMELEEGDSTNRNRSASPLSEGDLDVLMLIPSRKEYEKRLPGLFAKADSHSPLSLLMLDLDHFKQFNDSYGHATGDTVLTMAAQAIRTVVGDKGTPFRYGGEEIVVLLPNHNVEEASAVASRIRRAIEAMTIPDVDFPVTVSIGVSTFPDIATDVSLLFQQADDALYKSKEEGRNRVNTAPQAGAEGPRRSATKSLKQDPFLEHKLAEARSLLSGVSSVERDFIRLLLVRGTCTNHLAAKLARVPESEVMRAFTDLPQQGLVERVEDINQSILTFSVSEHWFEAFKMTLFPRDEGDRPNAFGS